MTEEKKINYLWNAAGSLTPLNHTKKLLKSYYLTISRKVARYNFVLPKEKFGIAEMCEKCCSCWFDGNFSMKLISAKIRNSKAKNLVEDLEDGKSLTKKQKNRAKWYRKKFFSVLQFKCKLCGHKTNVRLSKRNEQEKSKKDNPEVVIPMQKQKHKKKIRDKFAGLKKDVLLQTSEPHKDKSTKLLNTDYIKGDIKSISKVVPNKVESIRPKVQSVRTTGTESREKQLKNIELKSLKIKKLKSKKSTVKQTLVVSKTQQKNTILQLAQMLKQTGNNGQTQNYKLDNRLKNLLK